MRTFVAMMGLGLFCGCGEVKSPGSGSGSIDAAPTAMIDAADTTPVTIMLTQMPMATTTDTSASFAWTSNKSSATFTCKLDNGAAAACTSPMTYSNLTPGAHAFEVDGKDASGNTGSANASWMISMPCAPSQREAESIPNPTGWGVASGSVLHGGQGLSANSAGVSFQFTFSGKGLIMYYEKGPNMNNYSVSIDNGAAVIVNANQPNTFTFQNPTTVASGLPNGQHIASITCASLNCEVDFFDITCN